MNETIPLLAALSGLTIGRFLVLLVPLFILWAIIDGWRTARLARAIETKSECMRDSEDQEAFKRWLQVHGRRILEVEESAKKLREDEVTEIVRRVQGRVVPDEDDGEYGSGEPTIDVEGAGAHPNAPVVPLSDASKTAMAIFGGGPTPPIPLKPKEGGAA